MKYLLPLLLLVAAACLVGCTENERAKHFGGNIKIDAPAGQTVVNMTWKETNLWIQYRDRAPNETPKTTVFKEYSSFGLVEGTVVVNEK